MITKLLNLKWYWYAGAVLLALTAWGIYANPDRKNEKINAELAGIMSSMSATMQQVRQDIASNKTCFGDESIKNGGSAVCVTNLRNIQETFRTADKANLGKLETYYQANQSNLGPDTQKMIENTLKLYKSDAYANLMVAYDQYFGVYIEWHKYFRDYVAIKGVDNMTSAEIMKAHTLALDIQSADANLKLKASAFNDYLQGNFSKDFIDALTAYSKT